MTNAEWELSAGNSAEQMKIVAIKALDALESQEDQFSRITLKPGAVDAVRDHLLFELNDPAIDGICMLSIAMLVSCFVTQYGIRRAEKGDLKSLILHHGWLKSQLDSKH